MNTNTLFAPAERATDEQAEHDARMLIDAGLVNHITHVIPSIMMILNKERQVVYANERLQDFLNTSEEHSVLGMRFGEILDCIHSSENCFGCGTTEFCSECGGIKAILKSREEKVGVQAECRITTASGEALELNVWASPYDYGNAEYTIFTILDIHNEKRRQLLEQTFFHDLSNMLTSISGHSRLLEDSFDPSESQQSIHAIRTASKELAEEIWCHRKLLQAENGELEIDLKAGINSLRLLGEIAELFTGNSIVIDEYTENFELHTDRTLLFRVLFNMVKNATEAVFEDEVVTIRCIKEHDRAVISVHNPGCMSRSAQLQVFQRSFSTKGKGRGIGTYSMRLFGEKYLKGQVGFTTSEHNGTTFHIVLPLNYPA